MGVRPSRLVRVVTGVPLVVRGLAVDTPGVTRPRLPLPRQTREVRPFSRRLGIGPGGLAARPLSDGRRLARHGTRPFGGPPTFGALGLRPRPVAEGGGAETRDAVPPCETGVREVESRVTRRRIQVGRLPTLV